RVKGTIRASRVKLVSSASVEGDIFHRSLAIEENARFEGTSRRDDNLGDKPRLAVTRATASSGSGTESVRKLNGAPENEPKASPAIGGAARHVRFCHCEEPTGPATSGRTRWLAMTTVQ